MHSSIPRGEAGFFLPPAQQLRTFPLSFIPNAAVRALLKAFTTGSTKRIVLETSGACQRSYLLHTTPQSRKARIFSLSRLLKYLFIEPNKLRNLFLLQVNLKSRWEQGKCTWLWKQLQKGINPNKCAQGLILCMWKTSREKILGNMRSS